MAERGEAPRLEENSMADQSCPLRCTLSSSLHSSVLLQGLSVLREQGQLMDVELTVREQSFSVHRAVLAACSDYFRAMFTGGMKEASQRVIELRGVSPRGLRVILDFAYSAAVTLDLDVVEDVLGAAVFLQMAPVVELCQQFLEAALSVETCLLIGQMAAAYGLAALREAADAFTCRHFLRISEEDDFLSLPAERLVHFLQSDRLQDASELQVFQAAVRWLHHDASRRGQASAVLRHVRFPLMRSWELVDSVQTVDVMVDDQRCRQFLLEAFNYQILPLRQHAMQSARTRPRCAVTSLVAFGGTPYTDNDRCVSAKGFFLPDSASRHFRELADMEGGVSHAGVAALDNFLYVAGGQHVQHRSGEGAVDAVYRYDPHLDRWLRLAPLLHPRVQFQLAALRGRLYAIGGRNRSGSLAAVERYVPDKDQWSAVEPLPRRLWGHAAAACGEALYVSGGYGVSLEDKKGLLSYDWSADRWTPRALMNEPRVLHAMVAAGDRLYALGGRMDHVDRCFDVLTAELYRPDADQWTALRPMRAGQSEAGAVLLDGRIFVVGGYNWTLNNVTSVVQVYDTLSGQWERDLHFPESYAGIATATLVLPQRHTHTLEDNQ